jgi:hypothetical protein
MKGASEFVTSFLTWFLGAILGEMVSSEVSHQMAKRGWTRKLCFWLIDRGSRTMPERHRESYLEQAKAEIENLLVERRHLAALRVGISFITNLRVAYALCYWVFCLTALLQIPFHIALFLKENPAPLFELLVVSSANIFVFAVYGVSRPMRRCFKTGLPSGGRSEFDFRLVADVYKFAFLPSQALVVSSYFEFAQAYGDPALTFLFIVNVLTLCFLVGGFSIPQVARRLFYTS